MAAAVNLTSLYPVGSLPSESAEQVESAAFRIFLKTAVVATAIAGQLASVAYKIAIEKDWLVVIAAGKSSRLASKLIFLYDVTYKTCSLYVEGGQ